MRPLIAILRGVTPDDAVPVAESLLMAGVERIAVSRDSPAALESVGTLASRLAGRVRPGLAGPLTEADIPAAAEAGARFVVAPNTDPDAIRRAKAAGLAALPGAFTATEAMQAVAAGAEGLVLFPAFLLGPEGVSALRAVLPRGAPLFAWGGVGAERFADYLAAGVSGFALTTSLYQPGDSAELVLRNARLIAEALDRALHPGSASA